jgi:chloramphenicol-sensitive protein RarD
LKPDKYFTAAISAFIIWGFIALPLKQLAAYSSSQILYYRILLALLCLPVILVLFRRKAITETYRQYRQSDRRGRVQFLLCTVVGSLLLTVNWLSFIYVVNHISIQTASFAYLLCPILTAVLGFVMLKERLHSRQWLAVGISLASCGLIGVDSLYNLLFSLFIAFSYALYLITQRMLKQYDKIVLLGIQVAISFLVVNLLGESFRGGVPVQPHFYLMVFILSSLFTILPLFLNLFALKELKSATVGILMYINPLVSFLVAFTVFNEKSRPLQALAYSLIMLSVVLYNASNLSVRKRKITCAKVPS